MVSVDEPLTLSAPLTRTLAASHCTPGCRDYHAMWQYFRALGLIDTIAADNDFLVEALRQLAATEKFPRVLISASADYGMLARVLTAGRLAGQTPAITVLDLCETPLAINRWYAHRHGVSIETVRSNLLDFSPPTSFDLICTHSFIGRLPPEVRRQALARWYALLRPGGVVVTTARVRHGASPVAIGFGEAEIQSFHDRALALATARCGELDILPATLAESARTYAAAKVTLPFGSLDEIRAYFSAAGFTPVTLATAGVSKKNDRPSGPRAGWKTERVRIIAQRD